MIHQIRAHLAVWDWRLFTFILLFLALPGAYQLYRVHLIGNAIPDPGALTIVAQWQFVNLAIEVFQEATVLAIYFFIGSRIADSTSVQLDRLKSILAFIFIISTVFAISVFVFRGSFVDIADTPDTIRLETVRFLGVTVLSTPFVLLYAASMVILQSLNRRGIILGMAALNVLIRFALDSLFFGGHAFSLDAGVVGAAWSSLLASVVLFFFAMFALLVSMRIPMSALLAFPTFVDMWTYVKVGIGSGTDSLIRNVAYFVMVIRIVNSIGEDEIGGYYLSIQIFWSFMLVPVLAFADSGRALFANNSNKIERVRRLWRTSMIVIGLMMVLWLTFIPFWEMVARALNPDSSTVAYATTAFTILFIPYALFSFNIVTDSMFYGLGKTQYMAYQSVVTNGTVYVIAFVLYVLDVWQPDFQSVMMLFGLGIFVDSILTALFATKILYFDHNHTSIDTIEDGGIDRGADALEQSTPRSSSW